MKPTLNQRWKWFFCGVGYRIPLCCVLRFTFCRRMEQGCVRGAHENRRGRFVPCLVFHQPTVTAAQIRKEAYG